MRSAFPALEPFLKIGSPVRLCPLIRSFNTTSILRAWRERQPHCRQATPSIGQDASYANVFSGTKAIGLVLLQYPTGYPRRCVLRPAMAGWSIHLDTLRHVDLLMRVLLRGNGRTLFREPSSPVHISSASSIFSAVTSARPIHALFHLAVARHPKMVVPLRYRVAAQPPSLPPRT